MRTAFLVTLATLAATCSALAFAALVGAGAVRRGGPLLVTLAAVAIVFLPAFAPAGYVSSRWRPYVVLTALVTWSLAALSGFQLFFPGERAEAVSTGLAIGGLPRGIAAAGMGLERLLPSLGGHAQPPPPLARPLESDNVGPRQAELAMDVDGNTLSIAVQLEGRAGKSAGVRMLFDTGASITTVSRHMLEQVGIPLDESAPEVTLGTANGELRARLAVLDRVSLGGVDVPHVTVAVCDACAARGLEGLLGLNVSGQFLVTLDNAKKRIHVERRTGLPNRMLDVAPWLKVRAGATTWLDGRVEVAIEAQNSAGREIADAEFAIRCDRVFLAEMHGIAAHGTKTATVTLPRGVRCEDYVTPLERASW